jgi:hypothetical protein
VDIQGLGDDVLFFAQGAKALAECFRIEQFRQPDTPAGRLVLIPDSSATMAWNRVNPRRRVRATWAEVTRPSTAALPPGRTDAIGCMRLRSS